MATFESTVNINSPLETVYRYLADFNNHQQLMPENIQDWKSTADEAHFNIQNMASLSLQITGRSANSHVSIVAINNPPFNVQLNWSLASNGHTTAVTFVIDANLNMMMKMLASGPLQKLTEHETQRLAAILG